MPVINNSNNTNNTNNNNAAADKKAQEMQAQLKLAKKTKSTDDVNLEKKRLTLAETRQANKSQEAISPRKGIKKSVSMSAICMDNDKCIYFHLIFLWYIN